MYTATLKEQFISKKIDDNTVWTGKIDAPDTTKAQEQAIKDAPVNNVFSMRNWFGFASNNTAWRVLSGYWTRADGKRLRYMLELKKQ